MSGGVKSGVKPAKGSLTSNIQKLQDEVLKAVDDGTDPTVPITKFVEGNAEKLDQFRADIRAIRQAC